ncbi:MAG: hypothetical protein Kow00133_11990 [Amphiplicatus sp.]
MPATALLWTGLFCCVGAIVLKLFPAFAFAAGAAPEGIWILLAFGLTLVMLATLLSLRRGGNGAREP